MNRLTGLYQHHVSCVLLVTIGVNITGGHEKSLQNMNKASIYANVNISAYRT